MKRRAVCVFRDKHGYVLTFEQLNGEMDGSRFSFTLPSGPDGTESRYLYIEASCGTLLFCVPPGLEGYAADCLIFPGNDCRVEAVYINEMCLVCGMALGWNELYMDLIKGSGWQARCA